MEEQRMGPDDIRNHQFKTKFRGFDVNEVGEFLQFVADELENRIQEATRLQEEIEQIHTAIKSKEEEEEARMKKAARELADVELQCASMLKEARITADEILKDARIELANIKGEIGSTRKLKEQLDNYLRSFVNFNAKLFDLWQKESGETIDFESSEETIDFMSHDFD
jgi:cell division initiation protein